MILTKNFVLFALTAVLASASAFAGPRCDRNANPSMLSDAERAELNRSGVVRHDVAQSNGLFVSYLFAEADFDAELAMGVYISCEQHAGPQGLGDFILKSEFRSPNKTDNPFRVYYLQAGSWGFSGGEYIMENIVSKDVTKDAYSYIMNSRLAWSNPDQHFAPKDADGFVRMIPNGANKVKVVACNYLEPNDLPFPAAVSRGQFNDTAKDRLLKTGINLKAWVRRVSQDSAKAQSYRDRLATVLGNRK